MPIESHMDMNSGQKETTKSLRVRTRENDAGSCIYSENEPRNNGDKGDTLKRTINTSNHVQRTAVFDSSLTRATDYITTPSDQGDTTTQLVSEVPGLTTILEEDIYNSEYHSIDPEVAKVYKLDKGVTTAHVRIDEECQTMESTNLSSNHWEESYCKLKIDRSKEYQQTEM